LNRTANTRLSNRIIRYGPLLIWAVLIFIGSSDLLSASHTGNFLKPLRWLFPKASDATLKVIHVTVRKASHFTEYAIFAWLAARAFRTSTRDVLRQRWFLISLLLVIAYALSDEFHQSFVSTRTASIYDSAIDIAGGLAALIVVWLRRRSSARPSSDYYYDDSTGYEVYEDTEDESDEEISQPEVR
jgi:VanZ family protein